jgi:hypothetical protein
MPGAIFAMPAWKSTFVIHEIYPSSVVVGVLGKHQILDWGLFHSSSNYV